MSDDKPRIPATPPANTDSEVRLKFSDFELCITFRGLMGSALAPVILKLWNLERVGGGHEFHETLFSKNYPNVNVSRIKTKFAKENSALLFQHKVHIYIELIERS